MILPKEAGSRWYHIQRTFLATVSHSLAERCSENYNHLDVSNEALRIFLAWLLYDDIDRAVNSQKSLAEAWNFGAKYLMPRFQDAVMHVLVPYLQEVYVCPYAVLEAYRVKERATLLQRAFVAQLAIDMVSQEGFRWGEEVFTEHKLENVEGFYLALTQAMCVTLDHNICVEKYIEAADFLLNDRDE